METSSTPRLDPPHEHRPQTHLFNTEDFRECTKGKLAKVWLAGRGMKPPHSQLPLFAICITVPQGIDELLDDVLRVRQVEDWLAMIRMPECDRKVGEF